MNLTDPSGRDPWWYEDPHPTATVRSGSAYEEIEAHDRRCHERDYLATISGQKPGPCDANVLIDYPHESLDALGVVPGVGALADGANAALYCIEGDWANAGLAGAAMLPVLEWGVTAAKWGRRLHSLRELGQDIDELAILFSRGGRVGPQFDPDKLAHILRNLETQGVEVIRGADAERIARNNNAQAAYMGFTGGPGVLIIPDGATRLNVIEELIHLGQHRRAGWVGTEADGLERARREIEAQHMLLEIARRDGWNEDEISFIQRNLDEWVKDYSRRANE